MQQTCSAPSNELTAQADSQLTTAIPALAFLATFVLCYLRNFVLPNTPVLLWGDQMLYATNGARVLAGQMPYRDFFEFLTPGTDLTYALLFRLFGLRLWIPNLVMDLLAASAVLLLTLAARKVLRGPSLALPAIFALGFGLFGGLDATHHWFSTVIVLAAMLTLLQGTQTRYLIAAGALCGLTASFTQSKGAAVTLGFVLYLALRPTPPQPAPRRQRSIVLLCASTLLTFLALNLYYILKLGPAEWFRWIVLFSLRYYPTMPSQTLRSPIDDFHSHPGLLRWICIPFLYLVVPATFLAFLRVMHRRRKAEPYHPWNQLLLIAITGIAMFLAVSPSLSILRASAVCMPALILLAWLLQLPKLLPRSPGSSPQSHPLPTSRTRVRWAAVLSTAIALYLSVTPQRMSWHLLDLPAGRAAILDPGRYDLYRWTAAHTHPGQPYLGIAAISLPLHLATPAPIQSPGPWEYFRPEHIVRSIAALEADRIPLLILRPYTPLQGAPGYEPAHIQPYQDYIDRNYHRVQTFSTTDEAWQRNPDH
jgi:hypothetical protein